MTPEQLRAFCARPSRDANPLHLAPWRLGERLYATDGFVAVRVPALDGLHSGKPVTELQLKVAAAIDAMVDARRCPSAFLPLASLPPLATCRSCGGSGLLTMAKCASCDGKGQFEHHGHDYDCKPCDSVGQIEDEAGSEQECRACNGLGAAHQAWQIRGACFELARLHRIAALPGALFCPAGATPAVFRFHAGAGVLYPRHP